ncbi:MAG TPA: hypothetical protein VIJ05_07430, partial [Actinomycetes bacterium]
VLWAQVHDPPPPIREHRPDLPAALDDAIGRALAKAPGDRYPSCGALVAGAQAALRDTRAVSWTCWMRCYSLPAWTTPPRRHWPGRTR